jgi:hypothetical protein
MKRSLIVWAMCLVSLAVLAAVLARIMHYARDAVAKSWRWSCHRATIPRHRGTGPEAYLSVRRKVSLS